MLILMSSVSAGDIERENVQLQDLLRQVSQHISKQRLAQAKKILDALEEKHNISTKSDLEKRGVTNYEPLTNALIDLVRKYKNNQERGLGEKIIQKLIDLGADVQYETITTDDRKTGITLLDRALFYEEPRIANALLKSAKSVLPAAVFYTWLARREIYEGKTIMHFVVACQDANGGPLDPSICSEVYIALVKENAPQDIPDTRGETATALRERLMKSKKTLAEILADSLGMFQVHLNELATSLRKK
jgi:hypothetical protein